MLIISIKSMVHIVRKMYPAVNELKRDSMRGSRYKNSLNKLKISIEYREGKKSFNFSHSKFFSFLLTKR